MKRVLSLDWAELYFCRSLFRIKGNVKKMEIRKLLLAAMVLGTTAACRPAYVNDPYGPGPGAYPGVGAEWHGGIRARIDRARDRIDRGTREGSLTHHEARNLLNQLDDVMRRVDFMQRDGHLSHRERERIDDELDRLERNIKREKRDDDRRRW